MISAAILVVFPLCMAMAACSDLLTMTIPNRLSVVLIASFLAIAPFAGLSARKDAINTTESRFGIVIVRRSLQAAMAMQSGKTTKMAAEIIAVSLEGSRRQGNSRCRLVSAMAGQSRRAPNSLKPAGIIAWRA
ncbi:MAG: hypothetical protein KL863_29050 [Rhizobium sp.]|nr:hypothetical protein [Rhizobium sp.]